MTQKKKKKMTVAQAIAKSTGLPYVRVLVPVEPQPYVGRHRRKDAEPDSRDACE